MAVLNITVPDAAVTRVQSAFDQLFAGRAVAGRTPTQWVNDQLLIFIRNVVKSAEATPAAETARVTAVAAVDTLIP